MEFNKLMHLWGQDHPHGDAFVVADRRAIEQLRAACDELLSGKRDATAIVTYTADGEGYNTFLQLLPVEDPRWEQLKMPYTDEIYGNPKEGLGPHDLLRTRYADLYHERRLKEDL